MKHYEKIWQAIEQRDYARVFMLMAEPPKYQPTASDLIFEALLERSERFQRRARIIERDLDVYLDGIETRTEEIARQERSETPEANH